MIRLVVLVEGETEERFVSHLLGPHLDSRGIFTKAIVVASRRERATGRKLGRGGGHWSSWRKELRLVMKDQGAEARFTTLFDLYGLPSDFPELKQRSECADTAQRARLLEEAIVKDLAVEAPRLIPYLQRHEFEALVLAALEQLEGLLDDREDVVGCRSLRASIGAASPEEVNDGVNTAPSKRLGAAIPSYRKTVHGPLALEALGLAQLRAKCPRFAAWVDRLEGLGGA
ncbi:MAG: DUF4276 family protein [Myxococcaceae bacterium]